MNINMDRAKTFGKKLPYTIAVAVGASVVKNLGRECYGKAKGHLADRPKKMKKVKNPEEIMEKFEGK